MRSKLKTKLWKDQYQWKFRIYINVHSFTCDNYAYSITNQDKKNKLCQSMLQFRILKLIIVYDYLLVPIIRRINLVN